MNKHELRFSELIHRKSVLGEMREALKKEMSNNLLLTLADALDKEHNKKQAGLVAVIDRWEKEIDEKLNSLQDKVFVDLMSEHYKQAREDIERKIN